MISARSPQAREPRDAGSLDVHDWPNRQHGISHGQGRLSTCYLHLRYLLLRPPETRKCKSCAVDQIGLRARVERLLDQTGIWQPSEPLLIRIFRPQDQVGYLWANVLSARGRSTGSLLHVGLSMSLACLKQLIVALLRRNRQQA